MKNQHEMCNSNSWKKIPKKSYVLCVNVINNTLIMIKKLMSDMEIVLKTLQTSNDT